METYVVIRRGVWGSRDDVIEARRRAAARVHPLSEIVHWLRSYEIEENDGTIGSICVYEATSPEALRYHSTTAALPVDEILKVADSIVVRPDPAAAAARTRGEGR